MWRTCVSEMTIQSPSLGSFKRGRGGGGGGVGEGGGGGREGGVIDNEGTKVREPKRSNKQQQKYTSQKYPDQERRRNR